MRFATLALMLVAVLLLVRIVFVQLDASPSEAAVQTAIARTAQVTVATTRALPASQQATAAAVGTVINTGLNP